MQKLADAGLLIRLEEQGAYYYISNMGIDYIEGELGATELEDLV
jgi:hypothetical protein